MKRKIAKYSLVLLILISAGVFLILVFSPYRSHDDLPYKAVKESVEINAPAETVYDYLGNSSNAASWSVYVDHISPLNRAEFPDGTPGAKRRCFTEKDETGSTWDETIIIAEYAKRRRLNIYNLRNFSIAANHLLTEQLYEKTGKNSCRLTFTLFFDKGKESFSDRMKMNFAAYKVSRIFKENLQNIKHLTEEIATGK